jgi:hypothetical protein
VSETPYVVKGSREDIDLAHTHEELEKKKSRFSTLFSRRKNDKEPRIVEEPDTKMTAEKDNMIQDRDVESKDQRREEKDSKRRPGEKEEQGKDADEKVVYLTDEDIEDLLK